MISILNQAKNVSQVTISNKVVKAGLIEKILFEQRLGGVEGVGSADK